MVTFSSSNDKFPPQVTLVQANVGEPDPELLEDLEMPLPGPQTFFLGGIFMLSAFVVMYLASSIILPIVLAFVLKLLLQPAVRLFERLYLPRPLGALVAILLVMGSVLLRGEFQLLLSSTQSSLVGFDLGTKATQLSRPLCPHATMIIQVCRVLDHR